MSFLDRLKKNYFYWYTSNSKEQSQQWTLSYEPDPKMTETDRIYRKVDGHRYIDYLYKDKMAIGSIMANYWVD